MTKPAGAARRRLFLKLALRRPWLAPALLSAAWAFRSRGWRRRWPFLPLPSREYLRWRLETAYGDANAEPPLDDIARFVVWSARMRRRMRPARGRGFPLWLKLGAAAGFIALAVWINLRGAEVEAVRETIAAAGYGGLFAASVASGFNLVAPVPVAFIYPALIEAGFEPVPTVAVIAAGMTGGDLLGYLVGNAARDLAGGRLARAAARLEAALGAMRARHRLLPYAGVFLYAAFAPLPNELVVIPLAFVRMSLAGVMAAVLCGNFIFNGLVAAGASWVFG